LGKRGEKGQNRHIWEYPLRVRLLAISATASGMIESRPEQRLYLDLSRCAASACVSVGKWSRPLTAAEVSISSQTGVVDTTPASGTVRSVLGGAHFDVNLGGTSIGVGGGYFDGLGSSTTPPGIRPGFVHYTSAGGTITLAGLRCRVTRGEIGNITTVDTIGDDARDPRNAPPAQLPAGFLTGKHAPRCG
jgi:hypothetical protein